MNHHKYSPSSLERSYLCPFSVKGHDLPDVDNEFSLEGTLLHRAVETKNLEGLNDEQIELVNKCINFLHPLTRGAWDVSFESKVEIYSNPDREIDDKAEIISSGSIDCIILDAEENLNIVDFKFGRIEVESPENNLQLAAYALATMQAWDVKKCNAYIFQPRISDKPKMFTFTDPEGLLETIKSIITNCDVKDPVINPGEKQCQYCKLKQHLKCPALKNELATIDKTINLPELSNEDLTKLYLRANIVDKYLNAIKEEFKNRIEKIGNCGGYIMKEYEVKEYLVKAGIRKKIVKEKK